MATDSYEYTTFLPLGEISDFNGEDVDVEGWLSQIEGFFDRYQLDPLQRLAVIHNFMVGEATEWHYEMYLNWRLTTWESFVIDLRNRFSLSNMVNEDAIEVVVPEDSDDDAQIMLVESAIEDTETAVVVVDKQNDDDSISDLYHVLAVDESVVVGVTTREVTSNMFALNRCFLVLKDADIREWSFKTQFHAINGALPPCLLTICEFDPVKLLYIFVSKLAFGGSWRFIQPLIHVASCTKPPAKPPDDLLKVMCERKLSSLLYWSWSTLEETVAETAGGGASQIEFSRQLGARARVLQGSCSIISFDAVLSDFDFMMNEHKSSQKTIIIIGRFNVMVDGYCARSEIKKFMETVGRVRGLMAVLIPENTIGLITKDKVFSAYSKNQLGRLVHTYKGERHSTRDKTLLNMFTLYRIPPPPRGVPRIKDHFNLDVNGEKHGRFFIHYGPQESMQLWNGILFDPLTPCVIICFEQFSDDGGSDFHSALHQKFAHTVNILRNFAHQFMYLSYIDIGIQVKRTLLMEHFFLMRCDFHLEQRHCEADVVTIPILIFTLHGKPRNGNIGVQNDNRKGGGIDVSGEKIAADTKKDGWALQGINVSKAFGEMIVVFEFVDGNCLNNFCPNLWLKKYGTSQCLTTFGELILRIKELHFDFAHWSYEILVFQFRIKHEQKLDCDGGYYLKFLIGDNDQKDYVGHTLYKIMLESDAGIVYFTSIFDLFFVVRVEMIKLAMFLFVSIHNDETTHIYEFNMEDRVSIQRLMEQSRNLGVSWILGVSFIYTNVTSKMFAFFRDPISYEAFNDSLRVIFFNLQEVRSKTLMTKFQYYDQVVDRVFERLSTSVDTYFWGDYSGKTMVDWRLDKFKRNDDMYLPMDKQSFHQITDVDEKIKRELPPTVHGPVNAEAFWTTSHPKDYAEINFIGYGYLAPTIDDVGFICLFAPSTEILKTKDAAMQAVILRAEKNYEVQDLLLFATLQVSFGLETAGAVNIDEMKKNGPSVGIANALYRCSFLGNLSLADSVLSSGYANKIFLFSMPRPPESVDLEDKVYFRGMCTQP